MSLLRWGATIFNNISFYTAKIAELEKIITFSKKRRILIAILKLALFAIFVAALVFFIKEYSFALYIDILSLAFFIAISIYDNNFEKKYLKTIALKKLNERELKCLNGDLADFRDGNQFIDILHDYSYDLDIFEKGSLFQHINRTASIEGEICLKDKLLNIERDTTKIAENSEAIKELADKTDIRQSIAVLGLEKPASLGELPARAKQGFSNKISYSFIIFSYISVAIMLISLILYLFGLVPSVAPFAIFLFQLTVSIIFRAKINVIYNNLNKTSACVAVYTEISSILSKTTFKSSKLNNISQKLASMEKEIKSLRRILNEFDQRNNGLIYIAINGLLLRDIFSARKTMRWFEKNTVNISSWLEYTVELEALSCFGGFTFNNPDFIFPEVGGNNILQTTGVCHPLIRKEKRVGNDIIIGNIGEFFLITGANMAGKSTFIRSVGVNMILASCGAPVCAESFKFRPVPIFTSMRTSDKLLESASYFQAELTRLENMKNKVEHNDITLIMLDEILKGTNSIDKLNGSRLVLLYFAKMNAVGLVSTHDIALNTLENEMPKHFSNYSFEFEVGAKGELIFDYKLRKGVSKNMNAGILLKRIFPE